MPMNRLFTWNIKPYSIRSRPVPFQSQVETTTRGINSFAVQGTKQWKAVPADVKDIELTH